MNAPKLSPAASAVLSIAARYDAAGMGRRIAHWSPGSHGPNRATEGLQRIRNRARDSSRNDWAAEGAVSRWVVTLIGTGITPRWKSEKIQALWLKSQGEIDADGVSDVYAAQAMATRAWLDGGECFLRRRPRNPLTSSLQAPVQVQVLEADFCPLFDSTTWPGMAEGHQIYSGIEFDARGQRVAYLFHRNHPGDKPGGGVPNPLDLVRVLARDVVHVFKPLRPGQVRGVPLLAPVLARLRSSADFEDAVLDRQKLANLFTMFITKQVPDDWDGWDIDEATGLPRALGKDGLPVVGLEPGMSQELRPGEDVKFAQPPEPGATFAEYMRATHLGTASGLGIPYEFMAGDIKDVSDRTLRVLVNEFRRGAEQHQWHLIIPKICQPMATWWAQAAFLAGRLNLAEYEEALAPEWTPHGWPDIHPTQDIEGRIKARDAGFTSTSAIIARSGEDPRKVLKQRQDDEKSGLTPPPEPVAAAPALGRPGVQAHAPSAAPDSIALQVLAQAAQTQSTNTALVQALTKASEAFTAALAAVASAPVTVSVAAPAVTVTNEVQPAKVEVSLPKRQIETDLVERDRDGNIKRVVQTERTIN